MITTQPEIHQGFTFWLSGSTEGAYTVCVEAAPLKVVHSDRTFATASEAIAHAKHQIDIVNHLYQGRKIKNQE